MLNLSGWLFSATIWLTPFGVMINRSLSTELGIRSALLGSNTYVSLVACVSLAMAASCTCSPATALAYHPQCPAVTMCDETWLSHQRAASS